MRLHCIIGNHAPLPPAAANQGFQFSTCEHCGRDMVRSGRSWHAVPRRFRVVWREAATAPGHRPWVSRRGHHPLPVPVPGPVPLLSGLLGLADLVITALRVALWAFRDRMNAFSLTFRLLRPSGPVLRLPAP
jgi:hypothetical protein